MPVKITPSDRLTAIQLNRPPATAATRLASSIAGTIGRPCRSLRIADAYPPRPARAPVHRNSWPVLPKMTLNPTA
jgi:hypothetical protein